MEAAHYPSPKVHKPFPHRDPYGLDTMYFSEMLEGESWDISQFNKPDILSFSFLALRSKCFKDQFNVPFQLKHPSMEFRKSLSKKKWDMTCLPEEWNGIFPRLVETIKPPQKRIPMAHLPISQNWEWEDGNQIVGFGFLENDHLLFPKILDSILEFKSGRIYLRTTRQSFYYIPNINENSQKGLFVQEKESYNFPEFYYYWITLED
jgi:hypothetical protein